jgi:signal transduction histidine kinase
MNGRSMVATVRLNEITGRRKWRGPRADKAAIGLGQMKVSWMGVLALPMSVLTLEYVHGLAAFAPTLRSAVETVVALCVVTASLTLHWRFLRAHLWRDLLLMAAVITAGLLDLTGYLLPAGLNLRSIGAGAIPFGLPLLAALFVAAARVPSDRFVTRARRAEVFAISLSAIGALLAVIVSLLFHYRLGPASAAPVSRLGTVVTHPLTLVLLLAASTGFADAAAVFARRDRKKESPGVMLIAAALILLGAAGLYRFLAPSVGPEWIGPYQCLGVVAFALLLVAILRQELNERRGLASAAALTERQRVARDLHDGLAQDLAIIAAHSGQLAHSPAAEHIVAVAAQRALHFARETISELSISDENSVRDALEAVALEQRNRFGIVVDVDASPDAELSPAVRDDVLRIAREAIANAARHGRAKTVVVSLTRREGGSELLRVRDDGCGIPDADSSGMAEGFGLRSMRERAAGFGGALRIHPCGGSGTELEVTLP